MPISRRVEKVLEQEFQGPERESVRKAIIDIKGVANFEGQSQERMALAVIILILDGADVDEAAEDAEGDWRDLLMAAGLGAANWPELIDERFGPA